MGDREPREVVKLRVRWDREAPVPVVPGLHLTEDDRMRDGMTPASDAATRGSVDDLVYAGLPRLSFGQLAHYIGVDPVAPDPAVAVIHLAAQATPVAPVARVARRAAVAPGPLRRSARIAGGRLR